ncbi:MAG: pilus assembly FimT family protein [Thermodesulfobacteriota bacterium]
MNIKNEKGFNIIELLVVASVISVLVVIGGAISSQFFLRRSVDNITNTITSQINLVKLRASREGVEYRATLTYTPLNNTLQIVTTRGDSNRNANFVAANEFSSANYKILNDYAITPVNSVITFSPTGNLNTANTVTIFPDVPPANANIDKCGNINVSTLGRISTTVGRWDFANPGQCVGIGDTQEDTS